MMMMFDLWGGVRRDLGGSKLVWSPDFHMNFSKVSLLPKYLFITKKSSRLFYLDDYGLTPYCKKVRIKWSKIG